MSIKFNDVAILVILGLLLFLAPKISFGAIETVIPATFTGYPSTWSDRYFVTCGSEDTSSSWRIGTVIGTATGGTQGTADTVCLNSSIVIRFNPNTGIQYEYNQLGTYYLTLYANNDYTDPIGHVRLDHIDNTNSATDWTINVIPNQTTRFDTITFATSTGQVTVTGYINDQWNNTNTRLVFNQNNVLYGNWQQRETVISTSGAFNETFDYVTITSTSTEGFNAQTFDFKLYNYTNCESEGFGAEWFCPDGQPIIASTSTVFTLDPANDLVLNGVGIASLIATTTCSISSIDGCIRNSLLWAFTMSTSSAEKYDDIQQLLRIKAPTGYFFTISDTLRGVSATSTPTFAYSLPDWLKNNIFTPIRIGLTALVLWWFIGFFYKRVSKIQL